MNARHDVDERVKLAALWTSLTLCYLYGDYFELHVPGTVDGMASGDSNLDTPGALFLAALALLIPALMVCCSVVLHPGLGRRLNMVAGVIFAVFVAIVGAGSVSTWRAFYVLYAAVEVLLALIIVRTAWMWGRTSARSDAEPAG